MSYKCLFAKLLYHLASFAMPILSPKCLARFLSLNPLSSEKEDKKHKRMDIHNHRNL